MESIESLEREREAIREKIREIIRKDPGYDRGYVCHLKEALRETELEIHRQITRINKPTR